MMISEERMDLAVWSYKELAEMEAFARGCMTGVLLVLPFAARERVKLKLRFNDHVSIHAEIKDDETVFRAFGYHVNDHEDWSYSDEVFLCEIDVLSIDFVDFDNKSSNGLYRYQK